MLLSAAQIRAARALLDWSQKDLAAACGIARPTIVKIETEHQSPSLATIKTIISVFDNEGLEFLSNDGVKKKKNNVRIFRGIDNIHEFFKILCEHTSIHDTSLCIKNIDSPLFERFIPNFYRSDFIKAIEINSNVRRPQILICEGDINQPLKEYCDYKWMPKSQFNAALPIYSFGEHIALFMFLDEVTIFLIKDLKAARIYQKRFQKQWLSAHDIP